MALRNSRHMTRRLSRRFKKFFIDNGIERDKVKRKDIRYGGIGKNIVDSKGLELWINYGDRNFSIQENSGVPRDDIKCIASQLKQRDYGDKLIKFDDRSYFVHVDLRGYVFLPRIIKRFEDSGLDGESFYGFTDNCAEIINYRAVCDWRKLPYIKHK